MLFVCVCLLVVIEYLITCFVELGYTLNVLLDVTANCHGVYNFDLLVNRYFFVFDLFVRFACEVVGL